MKLNATNPLVIFLIVWLTAFFGISWAFLVGHWLGFSSFDYGQNIIGELLPLAYAGGRVVYRVHYGHHRHQTKPMRKILGDLGTMCLGVAAILIAAVIISIGADEGPQPSAVFGFVILLVVGVVLRILGNESVDGG